MANYKTCLILEPYYPLETGSASDIDSKGTREERDLVYEEIIEPAVQGRGYRIIRSSERPYGERVTPQIQELSRDADLLIANLTDHDPQVFFCLALRLSQASAPVPETLTMIPKHTLLLLRGGQDHILELGSSVEFPIRYDIEAINSARKGPPGRIDKARTGILEARRQLSVLVEKIQEREARSAVAAAMPQVERNPYCEEEGALAASQAFSGGGADLYEKIVARAVEDYLRTKLQGDDLVSKLSRNMFSHNP